MSLDEAVERIWKRSFSKVLEVKQSLADLTITLGEINEYFTNWGEKDIRKELKMLGKNEKLEWIQMCMKQIRIHKSLEEYRNGALAVIKAAEALKWQGDLTVLRSIVDAVGFKCKFIDLLSI